MSAVWQLLYRSVETYEMEPADLLKLLFDARAFNREHAITGLLLHHGGRFMQLLEGDRDQVQALYRRISSDARHREVVMEHEGPSRQRLFPDWTMGYAEAPEFAGRSALGGVESEREALHSLRALSPQDSNAACLLKFIQSEA
jgi:Sensors of blue-light using FAD